MNRSEIQSPSKIQQNYKENNHLIMIPQIKLMIKPSQFQILESLYNNKTFNNKQMKILP